MAYRITTPIFGAQGLTVVSTTAQHPLGQKVEAIDTTVGGINHATFVYAKASVAVVVGDCVWIKSTGNGALLSDTNSKTPGQLAFPQTAIAADSYGWMMQNGLPLVRLKPGVETSVALYVNASVGTLSATTVSGMILGVVALTSVTTTVGAVTCVSMFPTVLRAASTSMT